MDAYPLQPLLQPRPQTHLMRASSWGLRALRATCVNSTFRPSADTRPRRELTLRLALRVRACCAQVWYASRTLWSVRKVSSGRICRAGPFASWPPTMRASWLAACVASCASSRTACEARLGRTIAGGHHGPAPLLLLRYTCRKQLMSHCRLQDECAETAAADSPAVPRAPAALSSARRAARARLPQPQRSASRLATASVPVPPP